MIRDLTWLDERRVREIHRTQNLYPFPDLTSPLYVIKKALVSEGEVIGGAFVHLTSEVSLVLNPEISKLTRAKVIAQLFAQFYSNLQKFGLVDTHVFVTPEENKEFAQFLIQNFKFSRVPGIALERWYEKEG